MKKYGYIKNNTKKNNNINNNGGNKIKKFGNRKKGKRKIQAGNNIIKKNKNPINSPPNKKKGYQKTNKNFTIKNLKIIDNSSSINILKASQRDMIPQMNSNLKNKLNTNINKNNLKNKRLGDRKSVV